LIALQPSRTDTTLCTRLTLRTGNTLCSLCTNFTLCTLRTRVALSTLQSRRALCPVVATLSLIARNTLVAWHTLFTLCTLCTLRASCALGPLIALRTHRASCAVCTLCALHTLRTLCTLSTSISLGTLCALCALDTRPALIAGQPRWPAHTLQSRRSDLADCTLLAREWRLSNPRSSLVVVPNQPTGHLSRRVFKHCAQVVCDHKAIGSVDRHTRCQQGQIGERVVVEIPEP
jgi:hypothetical protein